MKQFPQKLCLDKEQKTQMADFIKEIGHLDFGSPGETLSKTFSPTISVSDESD